MPEVVVRRRIARRRGNLNTRVKRRFTEYRPQIVVVLAFAAVMACILPLINTMLNALTSAADVPEDSGAPLP